MELDLLTRRLVVTSKVGRTLMPVMIALLAGFLLVLLHPKSASATTLPPGFEDQMVATVGLPTALAPRRTAGS